METKTIRTQTPTFRTSQTEKRNRIGELKKCFANLRASPRFDKICASINADLAQDNDVPEAGNDMTAEQVLVCIVVKGLRNITYPELSALTEDSICVRDLMNLGNFDDGFDSSTIHQNIDKITKETLEETLDLIFDAIISSGAKVYRENLAERLARP